MDINTAANALADRLMAALAAGGGDENAVVLSDDEAALISAAVTQMDNPTPGLACLKDSCDEHLWHGRK